jgi:hypothetical protein
MRVTANAPDTASRHIYNRRYHALKEGALRGALVALVTVSVIIGAVYALGRDAPATAGGEALQGDADCSGAVNPIDSLAILRQDGGVADVGCPERADTNCDEAVDPVDSLRILRFDAGLPLAAIAGCTPIGDPLVEATPTPSPTPVPDTPTGEDLIDEAFEAGELTLDESVLYKAFWAFDDPRLPDEFDVAAHGGDVPSDFWIRPPGLSAETIADLDRFILPPAHPDSWYFHLGEPAAAAAAPAAVTATPTPLFTPPPGQWQSFTAPSGKVKVWWDSTRPADEAKAQQVAGEVDAVWAKHQSLMGIEPLGDAAISSPANGGDGLYDVYLAPLSSGLYGYVASFLGVLSSTPCPALVTYMVLNNANSAEDQSGTLAHELFHSFQRAQAYNDTCGNISPLLESTATWAEDYVYPDLNTEKIFTGFLTNHENSFPWGAGYGAFPFFLYLTRTGNNSIIPTIFQAAQSKPWRTAINDSIKDGFKERWPEFARYAFNKAPQDYIQQWEGFAWDPQTNDHSVALAVSAARSEVTSSDTLPPLSVEYYGLTTAPADASERKPASVHVNNPWGASPPASGAVQLAYKAGNAWQFADVAAPGKDLCLNAPGAQPVTDIVLIVSNSSTTQTAPAYTEPLAESLDACGWSGTASYNGSYVREKGSPGGENYDKRSYTFTYTASNLVFRAVDDPNAAEGVAVFEILSGTLAVTASGMHERMSHGNLKSCSFNASGTISLEPGEGRIELFYDIGVRKYMLIGNVERAVVPETSSCNNDPPVDGLYSPGEWVTSGETPQVAGLGLSGTYATTTRTATWTLADTPPP